jgi:hypothetical protein
MQISVNYLQELGLDPYVQIKNAANVVIYRGNHLDNDSNPVWPSFDLSVQECLGMDKNLLIQVFDHDHLTELVLSVTNSLNNERFNWRFFILCFSDDLIGECSISLRHISLYEKNPTWRLCDPRKKNNLGYKNSGFLIIAGFQMHFDQHNPMQARVMAPGGQPAYDPQPAYNAQPAYVPNYPPADVQPQGYGAYGQPAYMAPGGQPAYMPGGQPAYMAPGGQPAYMAPGGQPGYMAPVPGVYPVAQASRETTNFMDGVPPTQPANSLYKF